MNIRTLSVLAFGATTILATSAQATVVYSAGGDFLSTMGGSPSPWAYGYSTTLGGALTGYTSQGNLAAGVPWYGADIGNTGNPSVFYNTTASAVTIGSILLPGYTLAFHPGPEGQYSVIQFTAPSAGEYAVSATFFGVDLTGPTSSGVSVLVGGNSVFGAYINGYGAPSDQTTGTELVHLTAGETIDFTVGLDGGPSGRDAFYSNSTGVEATITAVPEPATVIAGALLLLPMGASTLRILRKKNMTA